MPILALLKFRNMWLFHLFSGWKCARVGGKFDDEVNMGCTPVTIFFGILRKTTGQSLNRNQRFRRSRASGGIFWFLYNNFLPSPALACRPPTFWDSGGDFLCCTQLPPTLVFYNHYFLLMYELRTPLRGINKVSFRHTGDINTPFLTPKGKKCVNNWYF